MRTAFLKNVAKINPTSPKRQSLPESTEVAFVPMASVSVDGTMKVGEYKQFSEVKNGFSYFQKNDILFAKITPCFENNKIAQAKIDCEHGYGSTEFHVIRPHDDLDSRYLSYFLRRAEIRFSGEKRMTGSAGQRRVPKKFLEDLEIPLLRNIDEQKRIAAILDQADALRQFRRRAIKKLNTLVQSIFYEMFGNDKTIPSKPLGKIAKLKRGPFGGALKKEIFVESGYKIYEQSHAIKKDHSIGRYFITETKYSEMEAFSLQTNDLIISCSGTLGRVYRIPKEAASGIIDQALLRIRPDYNQISSEFLEHFFESVMMQRFLTGFSRGSGLQNFPPMADVRQISIPVPKERFQMDFLNRTSEIDKQKQELEKAYFKTDNLFLSLQQRAFRGDL